MGRVIMVSDDVYDKLKRLKGTGESFSDVIKKLLKLKVGLTEVAGSKTITIEDWNKVKNIFVNQEKLDDIRRRYLLRLMER